MKIVKNLLMIFCLTIISGCFYTNLPDLPDIKTPIQKECPKPNINKLPPIPNNLVIEIVNDKVVKIDANGELLVRRYIGARKEINGLQ